MVLEHVFYKQTLDGTTFFFKQLAFKNVTKLVSEATLVLVLNIYYIFYR